MSTTADSPRIRLFLCNVARDSVAAPWATRNYVRWRKAAESARCEGVVEANHPDDADFLVFVEPACRFQTDVRTSSLYRRYRDRAVVLDSSDRPAPVVPGVYTGLSGRSWNDGRFAAGQYLRVADNPLLDRDRWQDCPRRFLYSFVGHVPNHSPSRAAILSLPPARACLRDACTGQSDGHLAYARVLAESSFVLAPRGLGVATWRLFEAMRMGRAVVVISDDWVEPPGVDWPSCIVRVAERDIAQIPALLTRLEPQAERMGQAAHAEWTRCFSMSAAFGWLGQTLASCHAAAQADRRRRTRLANARGLDLRLALMRSTLGTLLRLER